MSINSFREDEEQKETLNIVTMGRLFRYYTDYRGKIALVIFVMAVTIAISLVNPLLIERAINVHVANGDRRGLLTLAGLAVLLNVIYYLGVRVRMVIMARLSGDVVMRIRAELYSNLQTLDFPFFDSRPTGKILARLIGDVDSLQQVLSESVTTFIPDLLTVLAVAVIMLVKNRHLALPALATVPFLAAGLFLIQSKSQKWWRIFSKKRSNVGAYTHEMLSGMKVIQSFGAEEDTAKDFELLQQEYETTFVKAVRWADFTTPMTDIMWEAAYFLLFFFAARASVNGTVPIGTIIAFSTYIGMFWRPISNLSSYYNQLVSKSAAAERVFDMIDTPTALADREGATELPEIKGEVTFENVSFAYSDEPDKPVLDDVSFTAHPGETIALVGATGAGKTTIVNLISRFYDVEKANGRILIDGHDIRDVTIASLRRQMGVMTQESFIFSGTIRENIRYGRLDATDEEIEAAAKATGAHDFISKLEKGYDTELGEGNGLSVGQRQLVAFARTMLSRPRILILDEATSSIDTHTELLVQAGIEELLRGQTSFVIAHRLSTIKKADRIFVIDDGRIIEQGSHAELMELNGAYRDLYDAQFRSLRSSKAVTA